MKCTLFIRCFLSGFVSVYLAHTVISSVTTVRIDAGSERNRAVASLEMYAQKIDIEECAVSRIRQRIEMSPDSAADERLRKGRAEIREQRHLFERLTVDVDIILGGVPATLIVFAFKKIILKNKKFHTWPSLSLFFSFRMPLNSPILFML